MTDDCFTTTEAGKMLGVHNATVTRWIKKGNIKAFSTIGGHRRIRIRDLLDFIKENDISMPDSLNALLMRSGQDGEGE